VEYQVPPVSTDQPRRVVGYFSATAIVVANMVGTGVFATLGLQAELIPEPGLLLVIWLIGGLIALCGAFVMASSRRPCPAPAVSIIFWAASITRYLAWRPG
jgi:APA family basic amino acid/polyamine antiporter